MAPSSLLAQSKVGDGAEQSQANAAKRRRVSKKSPAVLNGAANRPKIMGDVLRRSLDKFAVTPGQSNFATTEYTVPLLSALQLPILMSLNRTIRMPDMQQWYLARRQDITESMPSGAELVQGLGSEVEADVFGRIMAGVHIANYEHMLWQCRQWQKQYVYSSHCDGYKADRLKLNLTQDINENLSQIEQLYRLTLNEKAVVWMERPPQHLETFLPLSLGNLLQAFDPQGLVIKVRMLETAASTLERLFLNGTHLLLEIGENNENLYRLAQDGLAKNTPQRYTSERYGVELSVLSSNVLEDPMQRARLARSGWICEVKIGEERHIYLLWWHKDIPSNLDQVAEACYYLNGPGPRLYWTDVPQDYSRLSLPPIEQRLGRNLVILGRFIRHVLNHEQSYKSIYKHYSQESGALSKEKLQSYLGTVPAGSSSLIRYLLNRLDRYQPG